MPPRRGGDSDEDEDELAAMRAARGGGGGAQKGNPSSMRGPPDDEDAFLPNAPRPAKGPARPPPGWQPEEAEEIDKVEEVRAIPPSSLYAGGHSLHPSANSDASSALSPLALTSENAHERVIITG